jgi:hypothetical protein
MDTLIKEFELHTVVKDGKQCISYTDIRNKLHIKRLASLMDKKYLIQEITNISTDEDDVQLKYSLKLNI